MTELEQQLTALGDKIDWPHTPELRLHLGAAREARNLEPRKWALAAAALVLAFGGLIVYQPSREAIAGWLNLHTRFQQVPNLASPSPQPPGPVGQRLGLGTSTTLSAAQPQLRWTINVPSTLGRPDGVYLLLPPDGPSGGEVTLVYAARPGLKVSGTTGVAVLITEARGSVNENFFGKTLGPGTTLEVVTVGGHHGYWIAGAPNVFVFIDADGNVRDETLRLAANTLILNDGGTIVRIEGDLTKAQALGIAGSLG